MRVELKICERCGRLWMRPSGTGWVYCVTCHGAMQEMAVAQTATGARPSHAHTQRPGSVQS
ncbi:MAG: hypothetical protein HYX26_02085 [Acidobacteriales bacterium]|nr:hypothetical protein [Terriglobales bacterium]